LSQIRIPGTSPDRATGLQCGALDDAACRSGPAAADRPPLERRSSMTQQSKMAALIAGLAPVHFDPTTLQITN
jgi:hypothetical protein